MAAFLQPFIFLSATGLILSVCVHIHALLKMPMPFEQYVWWLHIGVFIVFIPAVFVANQLARNERREDFWKVVLRFCPKWLSNMVIGFFGYAVINFIFFMINSGACQWRIKCGKSDMPYQLFSGHWMAFYAAALAILYAATKVKNFGKTRKCPNGHEVSLLAKYCQRCGEQLKEDEI